MMLPISPLKHMQRSSPFSCSHTSIAAEPSRCPTSVTVDGARVALTYKEFELLKLFLSNPGTAFTRDQLFNAVWGMDFIGETRTVDMHIRTLRQKLGSCGNLIETVRNVGYRLEAEK